MRAAEGCTRAGAVAFSASSSLDIDDSFLGKSNGFYVYKRSADFSYIQNKSENVCKAGRMGEQRMNPLIFFSYYIS